MNTKILSLARLAITQVVLHLLGLRTEAKKVIQQFGMADSISIEVRQLSHRLPLRDLTLPLSGSERSLENPSPRTAGLHAVRVFHRRPY